MWNWWFAQYMKTPSNITKRIKLAILAILLCCILQYNLLLQNFNLANVTTNRGPRLIQHAGVRQPGRRHDRTHTCSQPATNIFFLKVPKTGSTTMYGILNRMAISKGLRVVTYNKRPYNVSYNEPHAIVNKILPKFTVGSSQRFNMFLDHAYLVQEDIEAVLTSPISYLTLLRDPLDRLRSSYYYAGKGRHKHSQGISYYDPLTKSLKGVYGGTNEVAMQFGASSSMVDSGASFRELMSFINSTMLVGITEHYAESLILFRRHFCWALQDIVYVHLRKGIYHQYLEFDKRGDFRLRQQLCTINPLDCEIYRYFNKTFWQRIALEGEDFQQEVEHFQNITKAITSFCSLNFRCIDKSGLRNRTQSMSIDRTKWNPMFEVSVDSCAMMKLAEPAIANYHYYAQNVEACLNPSKSRRLRCMVRPKPDGPKYCDKLCKYAPNKRKMLDGLLETRGSCME